MTRFSLYFFIFLVTALPSCTGGDRWKMAAEIEQSIQMTSFPADTFNIADFGAVADDTSFLNTKAIEAAIQKCHGNGGGVVYVPSGYLDHRSCHTAEQCEPAHLRKGNAALFHRL
ncbi:MAG: hypothetical protein MZV63_20410 [Marinilabiliales bacterium]|nr:hypothetical protein [Marinilabiliales bacterium]